MLPSQTFIQWLVGYLRSTRGSSRSVLALVLLIAVVIGGAALMRDSNVKRRNQPVLTGIQGADASDSRAFYIAQTALDRSLKHLSRDPKWREGFSRVPFDSGFYDVRLFDAADIDERSANYVRIVASSEIDGVSRSLEAIWVNTLAAFDYAYAVGSELQILNHDSPSSPVIGNAHCNAWNGGGVSLGHGTTYYGELSSPGAIAVGSHDHETPAEIYGGLSAARVSIGGHATVVALENMNERELALDLNGDGDTRDFGVGDVALRVNATDHLTIKGGRVSDGAFDAAVGSGMTPVSVGDAAPRTIFDPRPDFALYYELASGRTSYPPGIDHVVNEVSGDGRGHYFASADAFIDYIDFQIAKSVTCHRCAGERTIGPDDETDCPACAGAGRVDAVVLTGVYYIDDARVDLSDVDRDLVVHGTIVVAQGNPYQWPARTVSTPAGEATIPHFPERGSFIIGGETRPHYTHTYRSSAESGSYTTRPRTLRAGQNQQTIAVDAPPPDQALHYYPAIIAADVIDIAPRETGFAYQPGDIGDERMTFVQGVIYAENHVRLHGRGGYRGSEVVFNEREGRSPDDALEEAILGVDLNGDGDSFDTVDLPSISAVPVIEIGRDRYGIDVNNDGVLSTLQVGADYAAFFGDNGYALPTLIYLEGTVLSQSVHSCEQVRVRWDANLAGGRMPYAFGVGYGSDVRDGLVSWSETGN